MHEAKPPFEMEIDAEIGWKTAAVRISLQETFFIYNAEWKTGAVLDQIRDVRFANQKSKTVRNRTFWNRRPAPRHEPVRSVPGKRTRTLLGEDRIFQAVVDDGIRARARAGVTRQPLKLSREGAANRELGCIVAVVTPVAQLIDSALKCCSA